MSPRSGTLAGVCRPIPRIRSFVIPVFRAWGGSLVVQRVADGSIQSLEEISVGEEFVPLESSIRATVGNAAIYGLEFDDCISVGPAMSMAIGREGRHGAVAEAATVRWVLAKNRRAPLDGFRVFRRVSAVPELFREQGGDIETPVRTAAHGHVASASRARRRVFSDFDEFADAIAGISGSLLPTACSERDWWVERCKVGAIEFQQVQIGGASTYAGVGTPGALTIGIPVTDPKCIRIDGRALDTNSFFCLRAEQEFVFTVKQAARWAGITLPLHEPLFSAGRDAKQVIAPLGRGPRMQSRLEYLDQLRHLITRPSSQDNTIGVFDRAAGSSAEQGALAAILRTIEAGSAPYESHIGRPPVSRDRVISNVLELIEARQHLWLTIDDLCHATGVSERTLVNVFQEYFGVGPMRLLKIRHLHQVRHALLAADPAHDTVGRIASDFGVWGLSSFARNYRELFGESPLESLRKPPPTWPRRSNAPWTEQLTRVFSRPAGTRKRQ